MFNSELLWKMLTPVRSLIPCVLWHKIKEANLCPLKLSEKYYFFISIFMDTEPGRLEKEYQA